MAIDYTVKPYCTPAELKAAIGKTGSATDAEISRLIDAASQTIDNVCNRRDGFVADAVATARIYPGSGSIYQQVDPCVEITGVAVKSSPTDSVFAAWDAGSWIGFAGSWRRPNFNILPYNYVMGTGSNYNSIFYGGGYTSLRGFSPDRDQLVRNEPRRDPTVQITARWGHQTAIPAPIQQACIMQASRWFKRGEAGYADALGNAEFGDMRYTKAMDHDIKLILIEGGYMKPL